ncbi:MAG: hypothetical protein ACXVFL_09340 [Solirubrobacteraceae bacterium]
MGLHPLVSGFDGAAEHYERGRPAYPEAVAVADRRRGRRICTGCSAREAAS